MEFLYALATNYMLICAVAGYFIAQILKILIGLIRDHKLDMRLMFASGGMPSSHASTVAALCISCARLHGIGSPLFAVTFILASIVMYDAAGVRRAAGEHARILNQLMKGLTSRDHHLAEASLKELIGHTPLQVVMGALLGIALPFVIPMP